MTTTSKRLAKSSRHSKKRIPDRKWSDEQRKRLLRYLVDARAVAAEHISFLQDDADVVGDEGVRKLLQQHRATAHERHVAVEQRIRELGGNPDGGRSLIGQLASRFWEKLHRPRDTQDRAIQSLIRALAARTVEIGLFNLIEELALELDDKETKTLAAKHRQQLAGEEKPIVSLLKAKAQPAADQEAAYRAE